MFKKHRKFIETLVSIVYVFASSILLIEGIYKINDTMGEEPISVLLALFMVVVWFIITSIISKLYINFCDKHFDEGE